MAKRQKISERQNGGVAVRWFCMSFVLTFVVAGGIGSFESSRLNGARVAAAGRAATTVSTRSVHQACPMLADWNSHTRDNHPVFAAINAASAQYSVDHELVVAIMATESNCQPIARSNRGARGIMQLMPSTARWLGVKDVDHVRQNIMGGAKYLSLLLKEFNGDLPKAVAAYNSGPAAVRKYYGVPPYRETRNYVARVMAYYRELQKAESLRRA